MIWAVAVNDPKPRKNRRARNEDWTGFLRPNLIWRMPVDARLGGPERKVRSKKYARNMHVAKDRRGKLDPKTRPCIFLGYGDDEFGYRVWDLVDKKVFQSRDIIFM